MRLATLFAAVIFGLAIGAAGVTWLMNFDGLAQPIDITYSLKAETATTAELGAGWGETDKRGTLLTGRRADLRLPMPQRPNSNIWLLIFANAAYQAAPGAQIEVRVNDQALGKWSIAKSRATAFRLPATLTDRANTLSVSLALEGVSPHVIIEKLELKDLAHRNDFTGHVDSCAGGVIAGWSATSGYPSPVILRLKGHEEITVMPSVARADLQQAGHPLDSGFTIDLRPSLSSAGDFEIVFPNGRHLTGSPCRA